jgi:thioredoxin 2
MTDALIQIVCPSCSAKNRLPKARLNDKPLCGKCGGPLLSTSPVVADDKTFSRYITDNGLPVVVDFWAPWCGPCKQFAPVFIEVAGEMSAQACFVKLDTEHNQKTAGSYNIRSIPTLIIFHHGKEVARMSGALPQSQFKQWLAQNLPAV